MNKKTNNLEKHNCPYCGWADVHKPDCMSEEFEKEFCMVSGDSEDIWIKKSNGEPVVDLYLVFNIKQYILKREKRIKAETRQEIVEIGDKMKWGYKAKNNEWQNGVIDGRNQAIKDYQTRIKTLTK